MLGNVGEKIQRVVELAEELYEKVTQLREQVEDLGETVEDTHDRIERLEDELAEQRAILAALAEEDGIDVDQVTANLVDDEADEAEDDGTGDDVTDVDEDVGDTETAAATNED